MTAVKNIILFLSFASLGFASGAYFAGKKEVDILYISKSELLDLETKRIEHLPLEDKNFFKGKPEEALKIIARLRKELEGEKKNLVFIVGQGIYGKNVKSISAIIHEKVIKELE